MVRYVWLCAATALFADALPVFGQSPGAQPPAAVTAVPLGAGSITLDGRLDEDVWTHAEAASDFTMREPSEGVPASERTEVRFVYTADALYVGARMMTSDPSTLRRLVARRDSRTPSERLVVSFDPRLDRTTAYTFEATPGGVRSDWFHGADREGALDRSYDPVWELSTRVDESGWTAEFRIPFSQLRFNPGRVQTWGLNVVRHVPSRNEESYWVLVPRNATGWSSRMGQLSGLESIGRTRRIEVLPYLAAGATRRGEVDPDDPFAERATAHVRAGADVKVGLGPHLTLDATINPDFGQVEADPAEVNLTAFETFFSERRPFFVEGRNLFGLRSTFYSRRIGARPPLRAQAAFAERPENSTILGAAKLTGRLPSGLSIGVLGALTAEESVRTFEPEAGAFGQQVVAPRTVFAVATAQQELGRDRSTLSLALTGVDRQLTAGSPLAEVVADQAVTGAVDGRWRWAGGAYDVSAYLGFSHIRGDARAIHRQQLSSRRYFQRPDADHVVVDPTRTSMSGIQAGINHSKMAGSWLWDIDFIYESPGQELNDIGRMGNTDDQAVFAGARYRQTEPSAWLHNWTVGAFHAIEGNTGGVRTSQVASLFGLATFKNFWRAELELSIQPRAWSDSQTRGGPLMQTARAHGLAWDLTGNPGSRTQWSLSWRGRRDELEGWFSSFNGELSVRPGTRWEFSIRPRYSRSDVSRQYVTSISDAAAVSTFGTRYVFARLDRTDVVAQMRASLALGPDLTLETYVEPFVASGTYSGYGDLTAPRTFVLATYDATGSNTYDGPTPDFHVRSFRSNAVLRWEWRPGSTLFLVWQQNRFGPGPLDVQARPIGLWRAAREAGDHFLAVKFSYWLPVG